MNNSSSSTFEVTFKNHTGNPVPLGLFSFGITTTLLSVYIAGLIQMDATFFGLALFVGSVAQIIAGIWAWIKGNAFVSTAFVTYGFFWLAYVTIQILPKLYFGASYSVDNKTLGVFMMLYFLFTLYMFIGSFNLNVMLQVLLGSYTILYLALTVKYFTGLNAIHYAAGYDGMILGLTAIYGSAAEMLNEVYGKTVLPL